MEQLVIGEDRPYIPHEVVELVIRQSMPLAGAWRVYKGLTIKEVAVASDLKAYEVEQLEALDNELSFKLEKLAKGLGLDVEQLVDL